MIGLQLYVELLSSPAEYLLCTSPRLRSLWLLKCKCEQASVRPERPRDPLDYTLRPADYLPSALARYPPARSLYDAGTELSHR